MYGRPIILRALHAMETSTVSNVARTKGIISQVWQTRDAQESFSSASSDDGQYTRNDWERYVAPVSENISLV